MALQTDLNVSPYHDDFDVDKKHYKVLFKPSVAVQARELNNLQSILQNQIEKFGDNIFKRGTIIEGCNVLFHQMLPYVKIKDSETDGTPVDVSLYSGLYARNSSNVVAQIVKTVSGYESQSPDLNTLFVKYTNSGIDGNTSSFSANQAVTIFSESYPIFKYKVVDGSSGFANTDTAVIVSSLAVQNSTGGANFPAGAFSVGDTIQNGVANAVIVEANTTANTQALVLRIKPLAGDLQTANTLLWRFSAGETIVNANTANTANVVSLIGQSATATLTTDSLGKITSITSLGNGSGYYHPPYVAVSITSGGSTTASQINQLNVSPLNYLTTVTVGSDTQDSIGFGYGLTVGEGTIYQKGYFTKVDSQLVVVNKYSNTGFDKSVGFYTEERIVNSNQDPTLHDNATGTSNFAAPGADRLLLNPALRVLEKADAEANTEFLPIVEFASGVPYRKTNQTVYNKIGDEIAKRSHESDGNYVVDQFNLTTKDSATFSDTGSKFKVYIDPGIAYINGYRVSTTGNYEGDVDKAVATQTSVGTTSRFGMGSYLVVDELGGYWQTQNAIQVELYDTATNYITGGGGVISPSGTLIGYARARSLILESGQVGTPNAKYRLYLFDFDMINGSNPRNIKSIFYKIGGSWSAVADTVLTSGEAVLQGVGKDYNGLLVKTNNASKSVTDLVYTYRTTSSRTSNSTGWFSSSKPGATESFQYTGTWGDSEKNTLILVPRNHYQAGATAAGTLSITSGSANVTGTATSFTTNFREGDFIRVSNTSTGNAVVQIKQISNSTHMTLWSNAGSTVSGNGRIFFPVNVPISLTRDQRTVEVDGSNGHMTVYVGNTVVDTANVAASMLTYFTYNVKETDITPTAKSIKRGLYARVVTSNNDANTVGPWSLGVPDVFRLRSVHTANVASRSISFNANTEVDNTTDFISYASNPFSNGDSLVYSNTAGTTVVGGLANGTTYYVVSANSTGFKLSATRGGSAINLTANTVDEDHTLTGQPLYFTESSLQAEDVTNDYYIDHNQTEDFLDVSYLYLKPQRTKPSSNEAILVKFDAFTTGSGAKTISSYNIDDSKDLATLTSSNTHVNTMEIPEVVSGRTTKYYDLRDQIDFRPSAANTIPLVSDAANTSIINPTGGDHTSRISPIDWKFPVPDSDVQADTEHYLGRVDLVSIKSNGKFTIVKGSPGVMDKLPPAPSGSMTLQYIKIPPYPSLPASLSKEMAKIVDTSIANYSTSKRRHSNFKVVSALDNDQKARIQFKNYQMKDIASLERRIEALEYYTRFTLAETVAKARFIPSSLDGVSDRFKFGYFVDPFSNDQFSDKQNPEFYSLIKDEQLQPMRNDFNLNFDYEDAPNGGTTLATLEFDNYPLVSQLDATDGDLIETGEVEIVTVTQKFSQTIQTNITSAYSDAGNVYEDFYYTFSSIQGPARLFINSRDNHIAIDISQSDTPNGPWTSTKTSASAAAVTTTDITKEQLSAASLIITNFFALRRFGQGSTKWEHPGSLLRKSYGPLGGWLEDQFKLSWTHDPAFGQYVRVRVYKGKKHGSYNAPGQFWYKMYYPTDTVVRETRVVENPSNFNYNGTVVEINPPHFQMARWTWWNWYGTYYYYPYYYTGQYGFVDNQKFIISITGLKPNTQHKFIFGSEDHTAKCVQIRTGNVVATDGLLSDENGVLSFDYYYDAGIDEATTDWQQQNSIASSVAGDKSFRVESYDAVSSATGTIGVKTWTTYEYVYNGQTYEIPYGSTYYTDLVNEYNYNNQTITPVDTINATNTSNQVAPVIDYNYNNNYALLGYDRIAGIEQTF